MSGTSLRDPRRSSDRRVARFAAVVAVLAPLTTGVLGADTDTAVPIGRDPGTVDPLDGARLFFPADERATRDDAFAGSSSRAVQGGADDRPTPGDATPSGSVPSPKESDAGGDVGTGGPATGRAPTDRIGHPRFQAVLRVGDRVRVVVGDRPCREIGTTTNALRCDAMPDGVRSLALDADGRRLIATFADGRRERLAVGAVIGP